MPTNKENFQAACERARVLSLRSDYKGCSVHVNAIIRLVSGEPIIAGYAVSDWYADGQTIATFINGQAKD